ncbi:AAA family ATPase, partial [Sinorhizobium meliloti]|uniref:AAA family ATPase n=1 Tax=Rhizobium meliloti TaxID=382 RepID=UPI000FE064BB
MNNHLAPRRVPTVEHVAYAAALRNAARLGGAFRPSEGRQIVVVLRLPRSSSADTYEAAAALLVKETLPLAKFRVVRPKVNRRGALDAAPVFDQLEKAPSCLVLWPHGYAVPERMIAAADRIVDVGPVRPSHLAYAVKHLHGRPIDVRDAERMLAYPVDAVFAALRHGRPPAEVLRRLEQAAEANLPAEGPRLEDMAGYGEARSWGLSLAADLALWRRQQLTWADVDRGLLLSGPPGTGKTLFARALATTCEAELVATSVSRWQSYGHLGDLLGAMRKSFEIAVERRPSILFLDELDSVGDRASFSQDHAHYATQVVNGLLELVDGQERLEGVVIVGATNWPEKIDPALLRPGRLDRHIRISLPDAQERRQLARLYFTNDLAEQDLDAISAATAGFT